MHLFHQNWNNFSVCMQILQWFLCSDTSRKDTLARQSFPDYQFLFRKCNPVSLMSKIMESSVAGLLKKIRAVITILPAKPRIFQPKKTSTSYYAHRVMHKVNLKTSYCTQLKNSLKVIKRRKTSQPKKSFPKFKWLVKINSSQAANKRHLLFCLNIT